MYYFEGFFPIFLFLKDDSIILDSVFLKFLVSRILFANYITYSKWYEVNCIQSICKKPPLVKYLKKI